MRYGFLVVFPGSRQDAHFDIRRMGIYHEYLVRLAWRDVGRGLACPDEANPVRAIAAGVEQEVRLLLPEVASPGPVLARVRREPQLGMSGEGLLPEHLDKVSPVLARGQGFLFVVIASWGGGLPIGRQVWMPDERQVLADIVDGNVVAHLPHGLEFLGRLIVKRCIIRPRRIFLPCLPVRVLVRRGATTQQHSH